MRLEPQATPLFSREQNRKRHRRVVAALMLTLGVNRPLGPIQTNDGNMMVLKSSTRRHLKWDTRYL